jgi:hypothetical protein
MAIKIPKIKKKNSWQAKLARLVLGLVVLAVIAFLAVSNWRVYKNRQVMDVQVKELQEKIQILEERRETLKAGLNAASGESFQEEKMREQGYKKPGEEVIAVLQDASTSATKQSEPVSGDNFWTDLWTKIKDIK